MTMRRWTEDDDESARDEDVDHVGRVRVRLSPSVSNSVKLCRGVPTHPLNFALFLAATLHCKDGRCCEHRLVSSQLGGTGCSTEAGVTSRKNVGIARRALPPRGGGTQLHRSSVQAAACELKLAPGCVGRRLVLLLCSHPDRLLRL